MKTYLEPKLDVVLIENDVIVTSPGGDEDELPVLGGDFDDFWG